MRLGIQPLRCEPRRAVVVARIAVTAVAHERHNTAALPLGDHLRHQLPDAPEVGARGRARHAAPPAPAGAAWRRRRRRPGTWIMWSITAGTKLGSIRGRPMPSIREGQAGAEVSRAAAPAGVERRVLRVHHGQPRVVAVVAEVPADGGAGAARSGAHHDPAGDRVLFQRQLPEDGLGDVVVAAPVRGPLGVGELVHVVAVARGGHLRRGRVDLRGMVHQQAGAAELLDQRNLLRAGGARHDGDERQAQQLREVGFGDCGAAAGRLHDGGAFA